MAWLIVIFLLSDNYVQTLTHVITKRSLVDDANVLADPASVSLLRSRLQDAHSGVVIYAMNKLEVLDAQSLIPKLPNLIQHPAPEVRREAFVRVENLRHRTLLNEVQNQLSVEKFPVVKEAALRALGVIADEPLQLINSLEGPDFHVQCGALIGLLKSGNESTAKSKLASLLASASSADQVLAIQILGEVNRREFYPQLIAVCDSSRTSRAAGLALEALGAEALPEIESAFSQPDAPRQGFMNLWRNDPKSQQGSSAC